MIDLLKFRIEAMTLEGKAYTIHNVEFINQNGHIMEVTDTDGSTITFDVSNFLFVKSVPVNDE